MLAHLQPGSVTVRVGDYVTAGRLLGKVGDSGNSMEPHLHIGVVRGRHAFESEDGRPPDRLESVPFLIGGRFLIKGDTFAN